MNHTNIRRTLYVIGASFLVVFSLLIVAEAILMYARILPSSDPLSSEQDVMKSLPLFYQYVIDPSLYLIFAFFVSFSAIKGIVGQFVELKKTSHLIVDCLIFFSLFQMYVALDHIRYNGDEKTIAMTVLYSCILVLNLVLLFIAIIFEKARLFDHKKKLVFFLLALLNASLAFFVKQHLLQIMALAFFFLAYVLFSIREILFLRLQK